MIVAWRDPTLTLQQRVIAWCGAEMARGVREEPFGSNDSPRIREYFSKPAFLRNGAPIRVSKTAWCAAAACCAVLECLIPSEALPFVAYRVSGLELETDAKVSGTWLPGTAVAEPGMIAIWDRGTPGSWERHVTFVVSDDGKTCITVGGNEGPGQWQRTTHTARPRGFIRLDPDAPMAA